jgi:hypothetical protein
MGERNQPGQQEKEPDVYGVDEAIITRDGGWKVG